METTTMALSSSSSSAVYRGGTPSTYEELSMQQSLLFRGSLKDLKNLKLQLSSAAEYFEVSYNQDDEKRRVVNTLKNYAIKALVNTVDHLGSMAYKVNSLLDETLDTVSDTEKSFSCIEQRLQTCQAYIDLAGVSQQSILVTAPKFHKHYMMPDGKNVFESGVHAVPRYLESFRLKDDTDLLQLQTVFRSPMKEKQSSFRRLRSFARGPRARSSSPSKKGLSELPSMKLSSKEKGANSPYPVPNSLSRSGSLARKPRVLNSSNVGRQFPSEPMKSMSLRVQPERFDNKETEQVPTKSKNILRSLLSKRRSRKDEKFNDYLDAY